MATLFGRAVFQRALLPRRAEGRGASRRKLHEPEAAPPRGRLRRYRFARLVLRLVVRRVLRVEVEGLEQLPLGPAVLCFNHLNWADPLVLMAALPASPRIYFFGPEQEDMAHGVRNRLMIWVGGAVPFKPGRRGLVAATRRVETIARGGCQLAIAGEGRIHAGERALLPLSDGPAYFALRLHVPLVPLAINGTSWLGFRRRIRIRVGRPIASSPGSLPTPTAVQRLTRDAWAALHDLVADFPDQPPPGRVGSWVTELFNDWPEGARPAPSTL